MAILGNLAVLHMDRQFDRAIDRGPLGACDAHHRWCAVHYGNSATIGHTDDNFWIPVNYAGIVLVYLRQIAEVNPTD